MTGARGEVFDIGYQRYTGPREGRARARKAVWVNGVRTALGLGRGWPSKLLPILLFAVLMNAQLLLPNPFMPFDVRMIHIVETAPSNFLLGFWIGWLFRRRHDSFGALFRTA